MNDFIEIELLLSRKKELFIEYEAQTDALFNLEDESINNYIIKRDELAIEIDKIDLEIKTLLTVDTSGSLKDLIACKIDYELVSDKEMPIYKHAAAIIAILSRLKEKNDSIVLAMTTKKAQLRERLVETQNTPKIARYLGALGNTVASGIYTGEDTKA